MNSFSTGALGEPIVTERIIYKTIGENKAWEFIKNVWKEIICSIIEQGRNGEN